jgi:hypothetical protein
MCNGGDTGEKRQFGTVYFRTLPITQTTASHWSFQDALEQEISDGRLELIACPFVFSSGRPFLLQGIYPKTALLDKKKTYDSNQLT